mmetsp:Transcript_45763/g.106261  ORF Transcript_45763/g.106261 Transcript_45763/m.106261 type:complete len:220 (-) Transcript_45763:1140-1799(-)
MPDLRRISWQDHLRYIAASWAQLPQCTFQALGTLHATRTCPWTALREACIPAFAIHGCLNLVQGLQQVTVVVIQVTLQKSQVERSSLFIRSQLEHARYKLFKADADILIKHGTTCIKDALLRATSTLTAEKHCLHLVHLAIQEVFVALEVICQRPPDLLILTDVKPFLYSNRSGVVLVYLLKSVLHAKLELLFPHAALLALGCLSNVVYEDTYQHVEQC